MIRDMRAMPLLRGEGEINGRIFELQTWRRDGLLARLRERGISVLTLAQKIAALPPLPTPPPAGPLIWRPLAAGERFSSFSPATLRWEPLAEEERAGVRGVVLPAGQPLRRRRGRGPADYYLVYADRHGGAALRSLNADQALLIGYAQLPVATISVQVSPDDLWLPPIDLPVPHHDLLRLLAVPHEKGMRFGRSALPLVSELLLRLGITLVETAQAG